MTASISPEQEEYEGLPPEWRFVAFLDRVLATADGSTLDPPIGSLVRSVPAEGEPPAFEGVALVVEGHTPGVGRYSAADKRTHVVVTEDGAYFAVDGATISEA